MRGAPESLPADAIAAYQPAPQVFDEFKDAAGEVRPAWIDLAAALKAAGRGELRTRREGARQLLKEHGVTYNIHADGRSDERPWQLDLLPLLLGPDEWTHLHDGLIQRSRLLELVLRDFYGRQQLLRDGLVPAGIVHTNPGFLRPCHGILPAGGPFLSLQAVDLTRAPGGEWWVIADRTQAPSGLGYALENRAVISRVWPEELRGSGAQALTGFLAELKSGLRALAPWTGAPTIALLTAGPYTETYFEHAYLARQLGIALVEGGDLTVRQRCVYLKTLDGLHRVDVLLRRVDDTFCDPLELRAESYLGVAGLVDAARAGNVAISNALGSGAVEAPALLAFLPALARRLLNEDLRIPNVATWWCGQEAEREHTLANLRQLVIKSAFVGAAEAPVFAQNLSASALAQLARRIRERPNEFVGQERVALSTAPVWKAGRLRPHPLILRCYICATPDGYRVLPGGLCRVSGTPESPVVTSRHGGGSKDTWVLAQSTVRTPVHDLSMADDPPLRRGTLPSRFAENLFWLGRYAERLEDHARLLRTALSRVAGEGTDLEERELAAIKRALLGLDLLPGGAAGRITRAHLLETLKSSIFSAQQAGSARALAERIRFLAASLRDRLSGDTWRILNLLQTEFREAPESGGAHGHLRTLHKLIFHLAAFNGMEMENMTRGLSWRFLELGRRLERALNLLGTIRALMNADPAGAVLMAPLLEYSDSTMTYRRRHFAAPTLAATLALLLGDPSNPRSLAFQNRALAKHLRALPASEEQEEEEQHLSMLTERFSTKAAGQPFSESARTALMGSMEEVATCLRRISDLLGERFFTHMQPRVV